MLPHVWHKTGTQSGGTFMSQQDFLTQFPLVRIIIPALISGRCLVLAPGMRFTWRGMSSSRFFLLRADLVV
jgi:hypothetical protein